MKKKFLFFLLVFFNFFLFATENQTLQKGEFVFGSYGRIQPATNLKGQSPQNSNIVSHGSRLEEKSYLELDFIYLFPKIGDAPKFDFVSTIAFDNSLFQENGKFATISALRNLFVRVKGVYFKQLAFWAGSRMYRGDDIYLLDFWPLDNDNIYGGGIVWNAKTYSLKFHFGLNRLETDFQKQDIKVPNDTVGTQTVRWMDRQRVIAGFKAEKHFILNQDSGFGFKTKFFSEIQRISEGTRLNTTTNTETVFPSDFGWLAGIEAGVFGFGKNSFANFFAKYSSGLAAYGILSTPFGFDLEKKTTEAKEFLLGFSSNYEYKKFGFLTGSYARYFKDADANKYDNDDNWEFIFSVRPVWMFYKYTYLAFEFSEQFKRGNGLNKLKDGTSKRLFPKITKFSIFPLITFGGGNYARPQLRFIYTLTLRNDDAQALYNQKDSRSHNSVEHFLGISAEWWFNQSYR